MKPSVTGAVQPYSTKRDSLTIINCDSEPVHTPGCVQAHGALLVLRLSDFIIVQASDNAQTVLGKAAQKLLGQSISAIIQTDGQGWARSVTPIAGTRTDRVQSLVFANPARSTHLIRHN